MATLTKIERIEYYTVVKYYKELQQCANPFGVLRSQLSPFFFSSPERQLCNDLYSQLCSQLCSQNLLTRLSMDHFTPTRCRLSQGAKRPQVLPCAFASLQNLYKLAGALGQPSLLRDLRVWERLVHLALNSKTDRRFLPSVLHVLLFSHTSIFTSNTKNINLLL